MHRTQIRVQWFDTDRENVVYFGNYFRFFSVAEDEFLRAIGLTRNGLKEKFNIDFARIHAECSYRSPATYDDLIEVETRAELENDRMLTFFFRVFRSEDQAILAEGKVKVGCVRLGERFTITRIPEEVQTALRTKTMDKEVL